MCDIISIKDIHVGQTFQHTADITKEKIKKFVDISGDDNPLHLDEKLGKKSRFGKQISYGMLVATMVAPGRIFPGTVCLSQSFEYISPTVVGDIITIHCNVVKVFETMNMVDIEITAFKMFAKGEEETLENLHNGSKNLVLRGKTRIMFLQELMEKN